MAGASIIRTPTHTFYTNYSQFTRNPFQLQKPISNFDAALKSNERFGPLLGLHLYVLLLKSGDQYFQMGLMLRVNKQEPGYKASSTEGQNTFCRSHSLFFKPPSCSCCCCCWLQPPLTTYSYLVVSRVRYTTAVLVPVFAFCVDVSFEKHCTFYKMLPSCSSCCPQ